MLYSTMRMLFGGPILPRSTEGGEMPMEQTITVLTLVFLILVVLKQK